jgi:membrane protein YqaA with SNARE-associated domain
VRSRLLLAGHATATTAFMFGAAAIGSSVIPGPTDTLVVAFAILQLVAAVVIAVMARPGTRLPVAVLATLATCWGTTCSFLAAMNLSGNWF